MIEWLPSFRSQVEGVTWKDRLGFYCEQWKLGAHLVFRTKRFGVNNGWWSYFDSSTFGISWRQRVWMILTVRPFIKNLKGLWYRSKGCYIMTSRQYALAYGRKQDE